MFQRATTPARARTSPAGFICPCAPTIFCRAPRGRRWLHEIKQDGYRICARKVDADVGLWTRGENEVGGRFDAIAAMTRALSVTSCRIDGKAIVRRPDGLSDLHALRSRADAVAAILVAFDLLETDGQDLRRLPLEERCTRLAALIDMHARARGEPDPSHPIQLQGRAATGC